MSKLTKEARNLLVSSFADAKNVSPSLVAEMIFMLAPDSSLGKICHSAMEVLKDASKTPTVVESLEQVRQWIVEASTNEIDAIIKEIKDNKA